MSPRRAVALLLYTLGALVACAPWLWTSHLLAPDEYVHLYNVCALQELLSAAPGKLLSEWFELNSFPEPNWFGHGLLLVLGRLLPLPLAEKALVIVAVAAVGYGFLRRSANPWSASLGVLALTIMLSAVWQRGFVNYVLGMLLCLTALTATAPGRGDAAPRAGPPAATAVWAGILYFCHPIALLFFAGLTVLRELLPVVSNAAWPRLPALVLRTGLCFGLPFGLLALYTARQAAVSSALEFIPARLLGLAYFHNELILFTSAEEAYAKTLVAAALLAVLSARLCPPARLDLTFAVAGFGVLLAAIVVAPDVLVGGSIIHQRLLPVAVLWLLYAANTFGPPPGVKLRRSVSGVLGGLTLVGCVGLSLHRLRALEPIEAVVAELGRFTRQIPSSSVLLPVASSEFAVAASTKPLSVSPVFTHYAHLLGCERDLVLLDNYEATVGYFPLRWRSGKDPYAVFDRSLERFPVEPPGGTSAWTLEEVDYVLSLGPLEESVPNRAVKWAAVPLRLVERSDRGSFELWRVDR